MRKPVTSDISVLQGWPTKAKGGVTSALVAQALKLTVFQITARLKGMEGRGLVSRNPAGLWSVTGKEASPVPARVSRIHGQGGGAVGLPDDKKVPHIKRPPVAPCDTVVKDATERLAALRPRIKEYERDRQRFRRELMALYTERTNCEDIINRSKIKGTWRTRILREPVTVHFKEGDGEKVKAAVAQIKATILIAPNGKQYVEATPFESADMIVGGVRLRLYETSSMAKKEAAAKRELEARAKSKQEERERLIKEEAAREKEAKRELRAVRQAERGRSSRGPARSNKAAPSAPAPRPAKPAAKGRGGSGREAPSPARKLHKGGDAARHSSQRRPEKARPGAHSGRAGADRRSKNRR